MEPVCRTQPAGLRPRRSRAARAVLEAEMAQVAAMSIEERVKAALAMKQRFAWLAPAPAARPSGN